MEPIVIIDGGVMARAYYAGTDADGAVDENGAKIQTPGHALENFFSRYIQHALEITRLNRIIVVWDSGYEFRKLLYPGYKATRGNKSDELKQALAAARTAIQEGLNALGIPQVSAKNIEADDIIAYLVEKISQPGTSYCKAPLVIHTGDADLTQLGVYPNVLIYQNLKVVTEDPSLKFRHVALNKSLVGDSSDEYVGVRGFGSAAWDKLVEQYGEDGLDSLVQAAEAQDLRELEEAINQDGAKEHKLLAKIIEQRAEWFVSYQLAKLQPSLVDRYYSSDNEFRRLHWIKRIPSEERARAVFTEHGCLHLLPRILPLMPLRQAVTRKDFDEEAKAELKEIFAASPFVALDWETSVTPHQPFIEAASNGKNFVDVFGSRLTGAGFTAGKNLEHTFYFPVDHKDSDNLPPEAILEILEMIPESVPQVAHNKTFERSVIKAQFDVDLNDLLDTRHMASHLDEEGEKGLKQLSARELHHRQASYEETVGDRLMRDCTVDEVFDYATDDTVCTAHLFDLFQLRLMLEGTWDFVKDYECPSADLISDAFCAGVSVDWDELARQREEDQQVYEQQMERVRELIASNQNADDVEIGVENLFTSEIGVVKRAELKSKGLADDEIEKQLIVAKEELRKDCLYDPPHKVVKEVKVTIGSKVKIAAVMEKLGLPEFQGSSYGSRTIAAYLADLNSTQYSKEAQKFLELLGEVAGYAKEPEAPEHKRFIAFCEAQLTDPEKYTWEGTVIDLDSPKRMQILLYGILALPIHTRNFVVSKTRQELGLSEGSVQANEDAIRIAIADDVPEGDWRRDVLLSLLEAKKALTRLKMFYNKYENWVHPNDNLIHPQINPIGTDTRRPSGSSPNPLQWPKRGDGVKFRRCILPNQKLKHDVVVSIDWDQEELRLAAGLSLDPELSSCYVGSDVVDLLPPWIGEFYSAEQIAEWTTRPCRDVHSLTATGMIKTTAPGAPVSSYEDLIAMLKDVENKWYKAASSTRTSAKGVNFGSTYGIGAPKLSRSLLCTQDIAKAFLDAKKETYSRLEDYRAEQMQFAVLHGYVRTLYGSYRHKYEQLHVSDEGLVQRSLRQMFNFLIQGFAADILKRVLTEIRDSDILFATGSALIAPIYDELVFSCHHEQAAPLILTVHELMTKPIPGFPLPLLAGPSLGINFGDQVEIGNRPTEQKIEEAIATAFNQKKMREAA